ncbi:hypothetical protein FB451DRAFT_1409406 [Mycena latifolia]|nr:hypothetical protein FB451DRAFT_1409406 [Mycena latifolia]
MLILGPPWPPPWPCTRPSAQQIAPPCSVPRGLIFRPCPLPSGARHARRSLLGPSHPRPNPILASCVAPPTLHAPAITLYHLLTTGIASSSSSSSLVLVPFVPLLGHLHPRGTTRALGVVSPARTAQPSSRTLTQLQYSFSYVLTSRTPPSSHVPEDMKGLPLGYLLSQRTLMQLSHVRVVKYLQLPLPISIPLHAYQHPQKSGHCEQ